MKESSKVKEQKFIASKPHIAFMVNKYNDQFGYDAYLAADADKQRAKIVAAMLGGITGHPLYSVQLKDGSKRVLHASVKWLRVQITEAWSTNEN